MVAMAKIGINHPPEFDLIDVFTPRLKKPDQEIRETAAPRDRHRGDRQR
jgi:hypothetical protein